MIRVVADTNAFLSALLFGGLSGIFLDLALGGSFLLVTSPVLLDELDEKLRLKFKLPAADAALIRAKLESSSEQVRPSISCPSSRMIPTTTASSSAPSPAEHTTSSAGIAICCDSAPTTERPSSPSANSWTNSTQRPKNRPRSSTSPITRVRLQTAQTAL